MLNKLQDNWSTIFALSMTVAIFIAYISICITGNIAA